MTYLKLHFTELKYNIIILIFSYFFLFFICSLYSDQIIFLFIKPLFKLTNLKYFIYTDITEFFFINFFLSIFFSFYILIPFIFIQFWCFFSKGFLKKENIKIIKNFFFLLFFNLFLFYFIFIKIIPNIWIYFFNINFSNNYIFNFYLEPKLYNYFLFIFSSYIYIYIIFLYPIIIYYLVNYNIININILIFFRKLFYFKFIFFIIILITSEIYNQILIFICFLIIFELFIYLNLYYTRYKI